MAVDHVKSASITNLDSNPIVANTAGEGAGAVLKSITGILTGVASSSIDATYQMVRIPTNAKVKRIFLQSQAQTVGVVDVGVYYATDGLIGKPLALLAANAVDQDFFATSINIQTTTVQDVTNNPVTTANTPAKRNMPLWQAVGLTSDPGGNFDICLTVTTAITTGTGIIVMDLKYTD